MLYLREYRAKAERLFDHLPWVALIGPGLVLNKDGAFQRAARHLLAKQRQGRTNDEPLEARWGVATRSIVDAVTQIGR